MYSKVNKCNGLKMIEEPFYDNYYNNCYTYAINQYVNPYTSDPYYDYGHCQVGNLGGKLKSCRKNAERTNDYEEYIKFAKADLNDLKYDIIESTFEEVITDKEAWKVAFCYDEEGYDYHWYRQNLDGTWSHKQGKGDISNEDFSGHVIYNPKECDRGNYNTFKGFYMIVKLEQ